MMLAFTLSMPRANSWNGKWSGEGRLYCIIKTFSGAKGGKRAAEILAKRSYHYSWPDGWGARIDVREVDAAEAERLRKYSVGFAGYDWMVESILNYGKILADHEIADFLAARKAAEQSPAETAGAK